ncbi:unnamed protein product [Ectocarpus sp. 4 AP-2014]
MGMWRRKVASGDDNSQTRERRQWFSFGAMKKAKCSEKDNEAPASANVAAATTGHPGWRLVGLRPMSGVMVLPYQSWHTTGWRRQLPEDRIAPADTSNKRNQAPFLRKNAKACLPVALVLVFALCAWRLYKGKLPARQTRAADETAVAANLRDEEEGARDPPPAVPIRGPEGRAVAGAAGAVVSRPTVLNQALEGIEEGSAAQAPAIVVNTNGDGRRGRRVPSPAIGRGGLQGEARVRSPPARVRVPVGAAAIVAATPPRAGLNRVLGGGVEEVEREAVVRMPNIAAIDVVPHPAVPLRGVYQGGEAFLPADAIGDNRGGEEGARQPAVGLVPILHRGEDFDLSHLPAGLGDIEQDDGAVLPPSLVGYLGEDEEKVEEKSVSEVRMPTIVAIDVVPHPAVPSGGVHQGGEAFLPADAIGDNRGGGEGGRQAAVGLMPTLHHGEDFDLSHLPPGLGGVEQEGGAVLPPGLFGYLGEDEEKVEEERVAEVRMPTIAATGVVPHPAVPSGGVHQGGGACLPADVIGGNRGGGEGGRQAAVGLVPTLHHGEDFDLSHPPAGLGDVEQEGGAVLPPGFFEYLGEDEEKVEEEERVAEVRVSTIAATDVIPHPAVPFGGVHQGGGACLPADVTGDKRGEGGRQAAVGLMPTLAANTTEVRHDEQAKSPHRPARFGDRDQGGSGAVLPTGLFEYLGEEEKREVVESAHTSNLTNEHAGQAQGNLLPAGLLGFLGGVEEEQAAPRVGQSCETSRQHLEGRQHEPIMLRERLQAGNDRVRHRESAAGWWMAEEKGSYVAAGGFSRIESTARDERFFGEVCSGRTIGATADQGMRAEATGLEGRAMRSERRVDMFDHHLELKGEGVGVGEQFWTKGDKTSEDVAVGMRQEQLVLQNMDGMASHTLEAKAEGNGPPLPSPMKRVQTLKFILDDSPSGTAAGKGQSAAGGRDGSISSMALEAKTEGKGTELETVQGLQAFPRGVWAEGEALPCFPEGRSATVAAGGLPSTARPGDWPLIRALSVAQTTPSDEQTRQAALTSLSRQVGQGWRQRGSIRRLFLANLAELCASDQVQSFAVNALKTADMPMVLAQPLGYGSFGRVDDVSYASLPGQSFAMKTVTHAASMSARFCALVEMTVFARLARNPHQNVLGALSMDDDSDLMPILLPKARCDLGSYVNSDTHGLGDKLRLVVDLARGVQHVHSTGLVHRDIKPGNVLVFESEEHGLHAKLADFGFTAEIGEKCPGGMGTAGAMAFETMSADPVLGAPGQDVVSVAVVLLMVCLKREQRCSNLFTQQELRTADETARLEVLLERARLGQDVSHETKLLEFEVSRRTMADGSFMAWLSPDKLDLTGESSEKLVGVLPSLLAVDPESREDMDFLVQFTSHLAEVNKSPEQPVEEPGRGG